MTRFDATAADARQALFAATVAAHRERGSEFCTLEPDETPPGSDDELVPWIQFGGTTVALDCTDSELERLKALLGEYPDFRIDDLLKALRKPRAPTSKSRPTPTKTDWLRFSRPSFDEPSATPRSIASGLSRCNRPRYSSLVSIPRAALSPQKQVVALNPNPTAPIPASSPFDR